MNNSKGLDIDCKLLHEADVLHKKLGQELKINDFLTKKHHHDNYKDIKNDVQRINNMLQYAEENNIEIDKEIIAKVNNYCSRLISERNLRKQRDLYEDSITTCDKEQVGKLENLIDVANKYEVEPEYIKKAMKLTSQMSGNIKARETL